MRLHEIHLEGFGRLANLHLAFKPGLNLIYGANETGKTTLQQAILALLYGAAAQPDLLDACRPWRNPAFYAGSLTFELDDGQAFRIARRFSSPPEVTLRTYPEGAEISAQFSREVTGEPAFAVAQLGLSREVYGCIGVANQGALDGLEGVAGPVVESLIRILTAVPGAAEARALEILDAAQQERAAAQQELQQRLAALAEERRLAAEGRRALWPQLLTLTQAAQQLEVLELQREQALLALARSGRAGPRSLLLAGDDLAAEVRASAAEVAKWQPWAHFPSGLRDEVLKLSAQRSHLLRECALAEQRARPAREALAALQAEEAEMRASLASPDEPAPARGVSPAVQALADAWKEASDREAALQERSRLVGASALGPVAGIDGQLAAERQALEPVLSLGVGGIAAIQQRLQAAREKLTQSKKALSNANAQWVRLSAAEGQAAGTAQGRGGKGKPAGKGATARSALEQARAEMVRCREEAEAAQRDLSDAEGAALWQLGSLLGNTLTDTAFAQLSARLERYLQGAAPAPTGDDAGGDAADLRAQLEAARERRVQAEQDLRAELSRQGIDATDLHRALAGLSTVAPPRDATVRDLERLRAEVKLELLRVRAEALQADLRQWDDRQQALTALEAQLAELLAQAGVACDKGFEAAIAAFDEGVENRRRYEKAQDTLTTATRYQRALLDVQAGAIVAAGPQRPRGAQLASQPGDGPTLEEKGLSAQEYVAMLQDIEAQRLAAQEAYDRQQAAIHEADGALRHLAAIDEDIAAAQAQMQRLERFGAALQLARDEVACAAVEFQKEFAPRLDALLQDGLSRIMPDRYKQATTDPRTLAVTVLAPETGATVPASRLSAGARQLVYLLLRLSIARLMSLSGEGLPILLDEPLASCDRARAELALQHLLQCAEGMQIFLFTKEEWAKTWLEKKRSELHQVLILN